MFDTDRRELSRGGVPIHLSQKAFLLLEFFIANASKALSKEGLYRHLWGDSFVDEANIPNLIFELRTALGDDGKTPHLIKTIHRFGYRFDAAVRMTDAQRNRTRFWVAWITREFPLHAGENIIGRDSAADVPIDSVAVSRHHAKITIAEGVVIEDLTSKNGTSVNGKPVTKPATIRDGDVIRLGSVALTFHAFTETDTTLTEART